MHIGIIGYGKMGKDIFSLFFDKLNNAKFTVLDLFGAEENAAGVEKTLSKSLRRKKITEEVYNFKKDSFLFTDKTEDMKDCDIIIEAIFEDMKTKKETFAKVAEVVSEKCLLLTNTSSLNISEIFADIPNKKRCFGLHFFYPVKLTGFVELNIIPETSKEYAQKAWDLVKSAGKKPIVFSDNYHIYLNQILACAVSQGIYLREYFNVTVPELSKALSGLFPAAGVFEVLDSVGLGLMAGSPDNFRITRNQGLLGYGCERMHEWLEAGCPKETKCFLEFMSQRESDTCNPCGDAELYMIALILNETVNALEEYGGKPDILIEAVTDTLGIAEKPSYYYKKFGADTIFKALETLKKQTGFSIYDHKDIAVWDKYFNA